MDCPLCKSKNSDISPWNPKYYLCNECFLLYLKPNLLLSAYEEKERYQLHKNDPHDQGYQDFLKQMAKPSWKYVPENEECLDWGCGPTKAMEAVFCSAGKSMESYDPIFYGSLPFKKFHLITCNEVAEHFNHPFQEFSRLLSFLVPKGYLALGTSLWEPSDRLSNWHYMRDPTHVSIFHETTIERICELFSLNLIERPNQRVFIFQKSH